MNIDDVSFDIEVRVPRGQAHAVADALTDDDDDLILAAETAMREKLGRELGEEVELYLVSRRTAVRAELYDAAAS
jgi:hypothetical protein